MLIRFTVENFLSFHQRIDFNLVASPETAHPHHVVKASEDAIGLMRTSLVFAGHVRPICLETRPADRLDHVRLS